MARLADSLKNLFAEIDAVWPNRDRRTDGWIGDKAHQQRQSDHNPDSRGIVHAIDIDKDGINPELVVEACISENRPTSYVVWNRQIWSASKDFKPRKYTGSNPHTDHIHVSIRYGSQWESSDWGWGLANGEKGTGHIDRPGPGDDLTNFEFVFSDASGLFRDVALWFGRANDAMKSLMR